MALLGVTLLELNMHEVVYARVLPRVKARFLFC